MITNADAYLNRPPMPCRTESELNVMRGVARDLMGMLPPETLARIAAIKAEDERKRRAAINGVGAGGTQP